MLTSESSPMPFGKYQGKPLSEVPLSYLIWLYENRKFNRELRIYIEENIDRLVNKLLRREPV